jgi:acyl carrier protein
MNEKIFSELESVFRDIFDREDLKLKPETTAADIEEWDSLAHISLVVAIEKAFKMRFSSAEIQNLKNVGDMVNLIEKKSH